MILGSAKGTISGSVSPDSWILSQGLAYSGSEVDHLVVIAQVHESVIVSPHLSH
jgi:hypothetical protein